MASLLELAKLVGGKILGDESTEISGIAGLEDVQAHEITMITSIRMLEQAIATPAAAIILPANASEVDRPGILVADPRLAFALILAYFHPPQNCIPGIHSSAIIGRDFQGENAQISSLVVIGDEVSIGAGSIIHPGVVLGDRVKIGKNSIIHANAVIREDCVIGEQVIIHAGAVIGADGFGYVAVDGKHIKVPQVGIVVIEDEVELGANVTVDRATTGVTIVKRGAKIDNQVQIAHNCEVGESTIICGQSGIAGSTKVGDRVTIAGKCGINGHITIGNDSVIAGNSGVISSLAPYSFVSGYPARPHAEDMRIQAAAGRLPEIIKEMRELQKRVLELEDKIKV